ncbi:MAG: hypothetical protein WAR79_20805 [Melioribacteraceae bacterium]
MNIENKDQIINHSSEIKNFIKEHGYFWWWVPEDKKENIKLESIIEATLNYGDSNDIRKLFELVGYHKTKEIFLKQISSKRVNYSKRTLNFFKLYFSKYA